MGGLGSGSYLRRNRRTTTEECKRLDIRWLNKTGALVARRTGSISWSSGDEPCGNIGYTTANDRMILNYKYQIHGDDEWKSMELLVMFNKTPCNFGGSRKWFLWSVGGDSRSQANSFDSFAARFSLNSRNFLKSRTQAARSPARYPGLLVRPRASARFG